MSGSDGDDDVNGRGGSGLGAFLLGVGIGVAVGFLFAPEAGDITRRRLARQARRLKAATLERADDLRELAAGGGRDGNGEEADEPVRPSARAELEEKLSDARRRRRERRRGQQAAGGPVTEEDEPVA